jgi:hypothetical protein
MDPFVVVVVLALIATVITLFIWLLAMSRGEEVDREFSTPLMWTRIGLQAFAVVAMLVALLLR